MIQYFNTAYIVLRYTISQCISLTLQGVCLCSVSNTLCATANQTSTMMTSLLTTTIAAVTSHTRSPGDGGGDDDDDLSYSGSELIYMLILFVIFIVIVVACLLFARKDVRQQMTSQSMSECEALGTTAIGRVFMKRGWFILHSNFFSC